MTSVLSARDLAVSALIGGALVPVIRDVSFDLARGKILGLVGESGAGKSMIGRAIAQLLPPGFEISGGALSFAGRDLVRMAPEQRRALLGRDIAFVPQAPLTALNPVMTIGRQFDEHLSRLGRKSRKERRQRAAAMLAAAHLSDASKLLEKYPHQLSGGMCQRVLIAMAFASDPRLVVADEPTTALDATIHLRIIRLIAEMQQQHGTAVVFITHDLRLATQLCDDIVVMYAGTAVESGPARAVLSSPAHPYTRCLELANPAMAGSRRALYLLPDQMPTLGEANAMSGCRFAPRCPIATDECRRCDPANVEVGERRMAACIRPDATPAIRTPDPVVGATTRIAGRPLLEVEGLCKRYAVGRRLFGATHVMAVRDAGFAVAEHEFVALVGESGSGKTTVAKLLVGLEQPSGGRISIDGCDVTARSAAARALRIATVQMVFQDPLSALNPRRRVASIVTQAMEAGSRRASAAQRIERTRELLAEIGLSPELAMRLPAQLSGGQRQRINIARALCALPKVLVADEIVSGLDVSVQAQLLHLLLRLKSELGFAMLFISHDLAVVRHLCSRVLVMYQGEIVEQGPTDAVFANPQHAYTRALLAAVPPDDPGAAWPQSLPALPHPSIPSP